MIFINKNLITVEDEEKIKCKDLSKRGFAIILTLKRLGQGGGSISLKLLKSFRRYGDLLHQY